MKKNHETKKGLAVITGASSGIGYELAKVFAQNGFNLLVVAEDEGINSAGETFRQSGVDVEVLQADLATDHGVMELIRRIKASGQSLDAIAMNAGVGVGGKFLETRLEDERNLIQLNIFSLVHLTKMVLPDLVAQGRGRILFTSSIAADMPGPYYAVYAASKSFVQSFAMGIREELKDTGVTVTALQPGATDTNFFERADMNDTKVGKSKKDDPADVAKQGFEAMMAGKDHVVGGSMKNSVQDTMAKFIPETASAKMQADQAKPNH